EKPEKRLLDDILRRGIVLQSRPREREQSAFVAEDQLLPRRFFAASNRIQQKRAVVVHGLVKSLETRVKSQKTSSTFSRDAEGFRSGALARSIGGWLGSSLRAPSLWRCP